MEANESIPTNHNTSQQIEQMHPSPSALEEEELDPTIFPFDEASTTYQYVDFVDLDKGNGNNAINNKYFMGDIVSPLNATTNSLANDDVMDVDALISAEQQLTELKLRLAMTESERDELEFELIKSRDADD